MSISAAGAAKKRVSTACGECKKAKSKCTGPPPPCKGCSKRSRECVFDGAQDGRRKEAAERALEAVQTKHRAYEELFESLRSSDDGTVNNLVEAIRSGWSLPRLWELAQAREAEVDGKADGELFDREDEEEEEVDVDGEEGEAVDGVQEEEAMDGVDRDEDETDKVVAGPSRPPPTRERYPE
ncbi:hypothetical protein TWF696_003507 [Orbilia brochopaga]|uniref:Zn(2)-C6 fungal-type domain-containing protein n=1 Tax=Orbilia brochopaga TaxID=3140254 RepID=A0AAV9TXK8_9PEZI